MSASECSGHCRIMNSRHKTEATKRELDGVRKTRAHLLGQRQSNSPDMREIPNNWRHLWLACSLGKNVGWRVADPAEPLKEWRFL